MPEAIVALGEAKRIVGRLRFESDGRRQHSQFEYADEWLRASIRFALSPSLPLRDGSHYSTGKLDKRSALSGCFADASSDSWGRALMAKAFGGGLSEFEYLVMSDDQTRHGALRFLDDDLEPLSRHCPPIPHLVDLKRVRELADRFERDPGGAEQEARDLAGVAGSLGGARPKASVQGEGHLWIAKFTSAQDNKPVERVEVATLKLATLCGLRAASARLELRNSDSPIALIRRFDRLGQKRIPYMSARAAMDWQGTQAGYYTDIADVIRQISKNAIEDLHELWRRIIFTILVSNTDDHLKNHGFIYVGNDRWRLSPAFDINPSPSRHRKLETGIVTGGVFDASLAIALDACEFFELNLPDARLEACRIANVVADNWKQAMKDEGATSDDVRFYADAFEHDDAVFARGLGA